MSSAFPIDVVGGVSRIDEDEVRVDAKTLLHGFHVGVGEHTFVPDQSARSIFGPGADDQKEVIHLAVHREDTQWAGAGLASRNQSPMSVHARFAVPRFAFQIAAGNDVQAVVFEILTPSKCQSFLIELLDQAHVTFAGGCFGSEVNFSQATPAHGAEGVPVETGIFLRGFRVRGHVATRVVEFAAGAVAVLEVVVARDAVHGGGVPDSLEIPLTGFVAGVFAPFHLFPLKGLAVVAMRADKRPLAHAGGFKLAVGVVVLFTSLGHEQAFSQPSERGDTGFCLRHVTVFVAPCLIADQPTNRPALEVGFVVCTQHPQRHAIGEVDRVVAFLVAVGWVERPHGDAFIK